MQLQQVMLNLIVNAIEAMGATSTGPRELRISTAPDSSNGVSIAVRGLTLSGSNLTPAFAATPSPEPPRPRWTTDRTFATFETKPQDPIVHSISLPCFITHLKLSSRAADNRFMYHRLYRFVKLIESKSMKHFFDKALAERYGYGLAVFIAAETSDFQRAIDRTNARRERDGRSLLEDVLVEDVIAAMSKRGMLPVRRSEDDSNVTGAGAAG